MLRNRPAVIIVAMLLLGVAFASTRFQKNGNGVRAVYDQNGRISARPTPGADDQEANEPPKKNRLKWYAAKAKKESKQHIEVPSRRGEYGNTGGIDKALSSSTVVVGEAISKRTVQVSDNDLLTWYKFNVLEVLTPVRTVQCPDCMSLSPPKDVALGTNEIWIPRNGGALAIDGVEIEQVDPGFPPFADGQRYLLFLNWHPNQVARTAVGPAGVFRITNGDHLESLNGPADRTQQELRSGFNSSLTQLRRAIQSK